MPQVKKQQVQDQLYRCAKQEFLKYGFTRASLRKIAKSSKISLANVYNYQPNKDALFGAVIESLKSDLDAITEEFSKYQPSALSLDAIELELCRAKISAKYVYERKFDFHLLLNQSKGSSLENYSEILVQGYVSNCRKRCVVENNRKTCTRANSLQLLQI